jgi:NAD(P)-dependent dehydrogenase (short-subunit alcohol dehydrogenase family)
MDLHMKGKVVIITGGGTGIGRAAAIAFLKEGAKVAICGRRKEKLDEAFAIFRKEGYEAFGDVVDARDYDALSSFVRRVVEVNGRIDIFINNAGANQIKPLMDYDTKEFMDIIHINLVTVFHGCKIAAEQMRKTGGGVILNASSFSAVTPNAGRAPYSAAKSGVSSLTRTFAAELAKDNIRVVAYVPGMIETEITAKNIARNRDALLREIPVQRFGTPEDLAGALVFLSSDVAGYINGTQIEIAGAKLCVQNPRFSYEWAPNG